MRSPSLIEDADGIRSVVGLRENILINGHDGPGFGIAYGPGEKWLGTCTSGVSTSGRQVVLNC